MYAALPFSILLQCVYDIIGEENLLHVLVHVATRAERGFSQWV